MAVQNCGTAGYNPNTASFEEYIEKVLSQGVGDLENVQKSEATGLYISANAYFKRRGEDLTAKKMGILTKRLTRA